MPFLLVNGRVAVTAYDDVAAGLVLLSTTLLCRLTRWFDLRQSVIVVGESINEGGASIKNNYI